MTRYHCAHAVLDGAAAADILVEVDGDRITAVIPGVSAPPDATRLPGLTLPGFANAHSHAFHRALRGRTHSGRGDFFGWREQMYAVAAKLDPDRYLALARATYAEMALAGYTCVGEFHYVHHAPDGSPYAEENAMSAALVQAAADAGIRITLLDTCYLTGGIDEPLSQRQRRFGDGDAEGWAERASDFRPAAAHARTGAAVHSVRAVPAAQIPTVARWAAAHAAPLHVHLSEQPAENSACEKAYHRTPTELLADAGALGATTTAVHATHLTPTDAALLGGWGASVCFCPTTEADLGDGIGPAELLGDCTARLCLGSDGHAVIDPFEEIRRLELDQRLQTGRRGIFSAAELVAAATGTGHAALGWPDAGRIAPGQRADLVTVATDTVRLAGADDPLAAVLYAGRAEDVRHVVVDGRPVVRDGQHLLVDDVRGQLDAAIRAVQP